LIADFTSEDAIVVIEFLSVVIEIFYLGPGQKAYGGALTRQQPAALFMGIRKSIGP
jgi:hypothetical protein